MSANINKDDFSASSEDASDSPKGVEFEIKGEKFTAKPWIQGIVLMDFLEQTDSEGAAAIIAFKSFLKDAVEPEEYERLNTYLRTSPEEIDILDISKGVAELIKEYTSRPTKASAQ